MFYFNSICSNPKVQLYAINLNLLQLLLSGLTGHEESLNQTFISRVVFTLSGLLRNMSIAQAQFIQLGGLEMFNRLLKEPAYSSKFKEKLNNSGQRFDHWKGERGWSCKFKPKRYS